MILPALLVAVFLTHRQDIPAGVRYKKASDAMNAIALKKLTTFFGGDPATVDFSPMGAQAIIIMPGMWNLLKRAAPKEALDAPVGRFVVPSSKGDEDFEGRIFRTPETQEFLWLALLAIAQKETEKPTIRKATSDEIRYYWAMIPNDIQEPLYVADFGRHKILFNFEGSEKDPRIFTVEAIGRLVQPKGQAAR